MLIAGPVWWVVLGLRLDAPPVVSIAAPAVGVVLGLGVSWFVFRFTAKKPR